MAEEDNDQKTEQPTSKRLSEAREKGQLPVSREVSSAVLFVGFFIAIVLIIPRTTLHLIDLIRIYFEVAPELTLDDKGFQSLLFTTFGEVALAVSLLFAFFLILSVLGTLVQTGFFLSLDLIKPDFDRILPSHGLKRIFSTTALVEFLKSLAKFVWLGSIAYFALMPVIKLMPGVAGVSLEDGLRLFYHQTVKTVGLIVAGFVIIALLDFLFQRYNFLKNLRMTKAEIKDEYKQQEGDPLIKSRLRQIRIEKARKRMMAQVPNADVVVTNPTHYAVALQYDSKKMAAPIVVAKGINLIAERIKVVAEENNIPLISNPPLARTLNDTVEIDQAIPTTLYRAVAEVISYVYKLKNSKL